MTVEAATMSCDACDATISLPPGTRVIVTTVTVRDYASVEGWWMDDGGKDFCPKHPARGA